MLCVLGTGLEALLLSDLKKMELHLLIRVCVQHALRVSQSSPVQVRRQLLGVCSPFPPGGPWKLNQGHQTEQQALLPLSLLA